MGIVLLWRVHREPAKKSERLLRLFVFAVLDEETRSLGQDKETDAKDNGPGKLNRERNPVGTAVSIICSGVIHDGSEEQPNRNTELVTSNHETSNPLRQRLRLVHWHLDGDKSDSETSKESAGDEEGVGRGGDLHDDTNVEWNAGGEDDAPFASCNVRQESSRQSADKGADGEDRDDERDLARIGLEVFCILGFIKPRKRDVVVQPREELLLPIGHCLDSGDGTGVISIQDSACGYR